MSRRRVALGLALVAVAGTIAWRRARPAPLVMSWPAGERSVYRFEWRGESDMQPVAGAAPISVGIELDGELVVRALGTHDGVAQLAVRLARVDGKRLEIGGRDAFADGKNSDELLRGREAYVDVDARGRVTVMRFAAGDPPLAKTMLQDLVELMQVSLPGDGAAGWDVEEEQPLGRARVHYRRTGAHALARADVGFARLAAAPASVTVSSLRSEGRITVDERARPTRIDDDVSLTGRAADGSAVLTASSRFSLQRLRVERDDEPPPAPARLESRAPGEPIATGPTETDRQRAWAAHQSIGAILVNVGMFAQSGKLPRDWIQRASAFLALHPEHVARLRAALEDRALDGRGHGLVMDLLAAAGTPRAQAAMRDAVQSRVVMRDPQSLLLLQRFGQLEHPERESVDLLWGMYARDRAGNPLSARAAAWTVGSMARHLSQAGETALATTYVERLQHELAEAKKSGDRLAAIGALGNADAAPDVVLAYTRDGDAEVRAEAATALRWRTDATSRNALVGLMSDGDGDVERAALSSLAQHSLTSAELSSLRASVEAGRVQAGLDGGLVSLLAANAGGGDDVSAMLRAIAARTRDPIERGRARMVLAQLR